MHWKIDFAQATKKKCCVKCAFDTGLELRFIQCNKIISKQIMRLNKTDKTLNCLRRCWHINFSCKNSLPQTISTRSFQWRVYGEQCISWKESLKYQSKIIQLVDEIKKKWKNLVMMIGYWECFTWIVFTNTAVHLKIANSHKQHDSLIQKILILVTILNTLTRYKSQKHPGKVD